MTDLQQIRSDLQLSEKRLKHTEGVVKAALQLAENHYPTLDREKVELAALMHDFTKEYTPAQHFQICARYGIALSETDRSAEKLLHARTAAAIAYHVYALPEDVCEAIRWHTTGRADMTPLETVIYLADWIEENRTWPACVRLRSYYEKEIPAVRRRERTLYRTLVRAFESVIRDNLTDRVYIDPNTVLARNFYLDKIN